jgi:hypothetical protein
MLGYNSWPLRPFTDGKRRGQSVHMKVSASCCLNGTVNSEAYRGQPTAWSDPPASGRGPLARGYLQWRDGLLRLRNMELDPISLTKGV